MTADADVKTDDVVPATPAHALPRWVWALDWFIVAFFALAVYVFFFGGFRYHLTWLGGWRVSAGAPLKLFVELALLVIARYGVYRPVSLPEHLVAVQARLAPRLRTFASWPHAVWITIAIAILTRLTVLFIGLIAVNTIGLTEDAKRQWTVSKSDAVNLPARWDSGWYLGIAKDGYEWDRNLHGQQDVVFFPAYPMLTRGVSFTLFGRTADPAQVLWTGVCVSIVAFIWALVYLYLLARDRMDEEAALTAVTLQAVYPFAVFFSAMYTEALFLLAAVGTFYHFSHKQFWRAAAFGLVMGLVRPNGFMIIGSLALIALAWWHGPLAATIRRLPKVIRGEAEAPPTTPWLGVLLSMAAPLLGLAIYSAFIYKLTGDPFMWSKLQTYWGRNFTGLSDIVGDFRLINDWGLFSYMSVYPMDILNGLGLLFGLLTIWPVARRLGMGYGLFVALNLVLPVLSGGTQSVGRFSSVLFPSFLWLGMRTPRPIRPLAVGLFALGLGLASAMFFTWREMY